MNLRSRKRLCVFIVMVVTLLYGSIHYNGISQTITQPIQRESGETVPRASLTRDARVSVTADTVGNLGPASVVVQDPPGTDWLKDRWQAASDMGGTAIPGRHWLLLDLGRPVTARTAVLDWEAAYADDYVLHAFIPDAQIRSVGTWKVVFDGAGGKDERKTTRSGKSPGHKSRHPGRRGRWRPTPLHVIHSIVLRQVGPFSKLRLTINKPAAGKGASLWQLDLYKY